MSRRIELPDDLVKDLGNRAAQEGEPLDQTVAKVVRAGIAVAAKTTHIPVDPAILEERRKIAEKFLSGEWGTQLDGFGEAREADRRRAELRNGMWRDS